ncbi:MAG: hypothetical protein AAF483_18655, partial [Planctomycetota bacterium]
MLHKLIAQVDSLLRTDARPLEQPKTEAIEVLLLEKRIMYSASPFSEQEDLDAPTSDQGLDFDNFGEVLASQSLSFSDLDLPLDAMSTEIVFID